MINLNSFKYSRVNDVPCGHVVAVNRSGEGFSFGIRVDGAGSGHPPILLFPNGNCGLRFHFLVPWSTYCLDLGSKPTIVWNGELESLSTDPSIEPVDVMILSKTLAIAAALGSINQWERVYCDLSNGAVLDGDSISSRNSIYITQWELGVVDVNGSFIRLLSSKLPSEPGCEIAP